MNQGVLHEINDGINDVMESQNSGDLDADFTAFLTTPGFFVEVASKL